MLNSVSIKDCERLLSNYYQSKVLSFLFDKVCYITNLPEKKKDCKANEHSKIKLNFDNYLLCIKQLHFIYNRQKNKESPKENFKAVMCKKVFFCTATFILFTVCIFILFLRWKKLLMIVVINDDKLQKKFERFAKCDPESAPCTSEQHYSFFAYFYIAIIHTMLHCIIQMSSIRRVYLIEINYFSFHLQTLKNIDMSRKLKHICTTLYF